MICVDLIYFVIKMLLERKTNYLDNLFNSSKGVARCLSSNGFAPDAPNFKRTGRRLISPVKSNYIDPITHMNK